MRLVLACAAAMLGCSSGRTYRVSDHYDGERFFNAVRVPPVAPGAMLRHVLFGRDGAWPDAPVPVSATSELDAPLGDTDVAVTHLNHATALVQLAGLTVLTDPVWSTRVGPFGWLGPERAHAPPLAIAELPRIDVVVVSHNHFDHLDLPTLRELAEHHHPRFFVPLGDRALLESEGIVHVTELDWWDSVDVGDYTITFTPAQHNSGRAPWDHDRSLWGSYLVRRAGMSVYFAGDTALAEHFAAIRARFGPVTLALLPIGAYAPREKMRAYHMDPADAVQAHTDLGAKVSIGVHFGTFQLTGEDYDAPPRDLAAAIAARGSITGRFEVLPLGHTRVMRSLAGPAALTADSK